MIKVVLIEDHHLVRIGFRRLLQDEDVQILGEAAEGVEGIRIVKNLQPDLVILDLNLPDISGLEVTRRLLSSDETTKILVVSASSEDIFPFKILEAGALSYLTKNASKEELLHAVKMTASGKRYISSTVMNRLIFSKTIAEEQVSELSGREAEVMWMIIRDEAVKEIAKKLHVSIKTVHTYRSRLFKKLKIKNNMGLLLWALKEGMVTLTEV